MSRDPDNSAFQATEGLVLQVVVPFDTPSEFFKLIRPGEELRLGRGSKNDIVIANPCVSREHAVIQWGPTGPLLTDLRTRNGTKLNKLRIVRETPLKIGDCVEISSARIHILSAEEVTPDYLTVDSTSTIVESRASLIAQNSAVQSRLKNQGASCGDGYARGELSRSHAIWRTVAMVIGGCAIGLGIFWIVLQRSIL